MPKKPVQPVIEGLVVPIRKFDRDHFMYMGVVNGTANAKGLGKITFDVDIGGAMHASFDLNYADIPDFVIEPSDFLTAVVSYVKQHKLGKKKASGSKR